MGEDLCHLMLGDAVVARAVEVVGERAVYDAFADQRADGGDRAQLEWEQGLPVPHLAKEDVVVEAGELGGEIASWSMRSALMGKGIPRPAEYASSMSMSSRAWPF